MAEASKELTRALDFLLSREPERLEFVAETGDGWQRDLWPEEPDSWWWFYGARSQQGLEWGHIDLRTVRVRKIANGYAYISDGQFICKSEGATGWWKRIPTPELPKEAKLDGE